MRDEGGGRQGGERQGGERERERERAGIRMFAVEPRIVQDNAVNVLPAPSLPPQADDNASATASLGPAPALVCHTAAVAAEQGRAGGGVSGPPTPPSPTDWSQRYSGCQQCGRPAAVCLCMRDSASNVNPTPNRHRVASSTSRSVAAAAAYGTAAWAPTLQGSAEVQSGRAGGPQTGGRRSG